MTLTLIILAILGGFSAGLRAMTPLAAASWAAALGWIPLEGTWLAFLGYSLTPWILTILALGEFVTDQLPTTPSRKVPMQFGARIVTGAVAGAVIGIGGGSVVVGVLAGVVGAVVGTLAGYEGRKRLVAATGGRDLPVALAEDGLAVVLAAIAVGALA